MKHIFKRNGDSTPTTSVSDEAVTQDGPESTSPVTRAEFNALAKRVHALTTTLGAALAKVQAAHERDGFADGSISHQLRHYAPDSLTSSELAVLKQIVKAFDAEMEAQRRQSERQGRQRAIGWRGVPY